MKKNWLIPAFLIVVFLTFLNGCFIDCHARGNGNVVSQERAASNFDAVVLDGVGNVNIHHAEYFRVVVTTDSNIQDIVTVKVSNNILYIDEKGTHHGFNPTKLEIDVYMPELKNVKLNGVGNIKVTNGKGNSFNISLNGVGNVNAQCYEVENVNVSLSGVGDIKTWATMNLTGRISGVGDVYYKGAPNISVSTTITGSVKKL